MTCPTYLLDDIPRPKDDLAPDGEGAHDRVARAMADLIQSDEPGGVLIGLEGRWGSGKSTVISLMRERLKDATTTTLFVFDAWAHERDPLRRSFLESLIRHFQDVEWVDRASWDNVLAKLANRRKVTTTRTVPKTTTFGKRVLWAALSVPLGTALVAGSLQRGVTIDSSLPVNWLLLIGISLSIAPFFVILPKLLRARKTHFKRAQHDNTGQDAEDDNSVSEWALLAGHAITETRQDTTETPEPTSIEFEYEFKRLMHAALLSSDSRRAVLVLDNLDRVAPQDALGMWSTLQTFLQDRSTEPEEWFKKIWIVVPYDKSGLGGLWTARNADFSEAKRASLDGIAKSFIDKTFQVRFEVPPPVGSNWRQYLLQLICKALPNHTEEAPHLYVTFDYWITEEVRSPTPRELKLYVNQIGSLHRQWQHEFPVSHLAYYCALRRRYQKHEEVVDILLSGEATASPLAASLPPNLRANLAGLLFNVKASDGQQLLLREPIFKALAMRDTSALKELEHVHRDGFWFVLPAVVASNISAADKTLICSAARCLHDSNLLEDRSKSHVALTIHAVATAIGDVQVWSPFTEDTVTGISAACAVVNEAEFSAKVLSAIRHTLTKAIHGGKMTLPASDILVAQLSGLADVVRVLGHGEELSVPFTLRATNATQWIGICGEIAKQPECSWSLFQPSESAADIASSLRDIVRAGQISEAVLSTIEVSNSRGDANNWEVLVPALEQRLNENIRAAEGALVLRTIDLLMRYDSSSAQKLAAGASDGGHLLHLFDRAQRDSDLSCRAWCLTMFLERHPGGSVRRSIGNSSRGHEALERILTAGDRQLSEAVISVLDTRGKLGIVFSVVDARGKYEPFLVSCLRIVADSENPHRLYSSEETTNRWRQLREHLPDQSDADRFSRLVGRLCTDTSLVTDLRKRKFLADDAGLYQAVLQVKPEETFVAFCIDGLAALESDQWTSELRDDGEVLLLLMALEIHGARVVLGSAYQDAIVDYAKALLSSNEQPSQVVTNRRGQLLSPLSASSRGVLGKRLLDAAIERDGDCGDGFFRVFGDEITEKRRLKGGKDIVTKLFSGVVRTRVEGGLEWVHGVLKKHPTLLADLPDQDSVNDFKERVQREISKGNEERDKAQELIVRIADMLGIKALPGGRVRGKT